MCDWAVVFAEVRGVGLVGCAVVDALRLHEGFHDLHGFLASHRWGGPHLETTAGFSPCTVYVPRTIRSVQSERESGVVRLFLFFGLWMDLEERKQGPFDTDVYACLAGVPNGRQPFIFIFIWASSLKTGCVSSGRLSNGWNIVNNMTV